VRQIDTGQTNRHNARVANSWPSDPGKVVRFPVRQISGRACWEQHRKGDRVFLLMRMACQLLWRGSFRMFCERRAHGSAFSAKAIAFRAKRTSVDIAKFGRPSVFCQTRLQSCTIAETACASRARQIVDRGAVCSSAGQAATRRANATARRRLC
jgi:hypothetical protein